MVPQDGKLHLKLVLVGNTEVGKTALITNYLKNTYTETYEPTVLDVYRGIKNIENKGVHVEIHDTSGDDHLGVNRKVQYQCADVFMICISCAEKTNLDSIEKWMAEVQDVESTKPILLIMTKSDLAQYSEEPITVADLKQKTK